MIKWKVKSNEPIENYYDYLYLVLMYILYLISFEAFV